MCAETVAFLRDRPPIRSVGCASPFGWAAKRADRMAYESDCFNYDSVWNAWDKVMPDAFNADLQRVGFNTIRLVVVTGPLIEAGMSTDAARLNYLMNPDHPIGILRAADDLVKSGMRVVFSLHPDNAQGLPYSLVDLLDGPDGPKFRAYRWVVGEIAHRLADRYPESEVSLEIWNECPPGVSAERWMTLIHPLFVTARRSAPMHTIVVSGSYFASIDGAFENGERGGLVALSAADFDANTMFTFHCYDREAVTHQGVGWEKDGGHGPRSYLRWIECPPVQARKAQNRAAAVARLTADRTAGRVTLVEFVKAQRAIDALLNRYYDGEAGFGDAFRPATWSAGWLRDDRYARASAWASSQGVSASRIWVGEFGINGDYIRDGARYLGADEASRAYYLKASRQAAEYFGFGWSVWDLSVPVTGWKITEPTAYSQTLRPALVRALFS